MIPTSSAPSSLGTSSPPPYVKRGDLKKPEPPLRRDTVDPAAATEWTPPSCLARYCTYVKHRIADFFDWVCSLFCSSKPVTKKQVDAAHEELQEFLKKVSFEKGFDKRYEGVKVSSKNETYLYLADYIEIQELAWKMRITADRWEQYVDSLGQGQQRKSGVVITERQLRADSRQLIEQATSLGTLARSDLPKKTTPAMIDKVKAYSLGKLTLTYKGKVTLLVEMENNVIKMSGELKRQAVELMKEIRDRGVQKFIPKIEELKKRTQERYKEVTLEDLQKGSQAVAVLADCIAVREICAGEGDVSEESLTKRIESWEKRLAQPVLGEATKEMYEKVKELDADKEEIFRIIDPQPTKSAIRGYLGGVVAAVQSNRRTQ